MAKKTKLKSVLTLLDVGTSKVCCMMVRFSSDGRPEVLGTGYAPAKGINAGAIVDLNEASEAIRAAFTDLEKQTERQIGSVVVNISSTQLKSLHIQKEIEISDGRPITASDVKRLVDGVVASCLSEGDEVIHAFPLSYTVDKEPGVSDPRGLYGHKLGVHMHVIVLPESQSRNLVAALDRHHVSIDMKVATPYASALATLTDEEKEIGATVVDFGAGTTSVAVFMDGGLVHLDIVPQGGNIFSKDIARGLGCSFSVAERLKTLHGGVFESSRDGMDRLIVPVLGEESVNIQVPKSDLISIIVPRLDEILENVGKIFQKYPRFVISTRHIVLNGGGSMLLGIKEKVTNVFGAAVRTGKPDIIRGLPTQFEPYTFSTCIGLLKYVMIKEKSLLNEKFTAQSEQRKGLLGKVVQWLVQNF